MHGVYMWQAEPSEADLQATEVAVAVDAVRAAAAEMSLTDDDLIGVVCPCRYTHYAGSTPYRRHIIEGKWTRKPQNIESNKGHGAGQMVGRERAMREFIAEAAHHGLMCDLSGEEVLDPRVQRWLRSCA